MVIKEPVDKSESCNSKLQENLCPERMLSDQLIIFHLDFSEIRGFPLLNHLLG